MRDDRLTVRLLELDDLSTMRWIGSPTHLATQREMMIRGVDGSIVYLCVCGPANVPLAMGGVSFATRPGRAELWQLATMPALQSLGLGTVVIRALEQVARERGVPVVMLLVERDNPRAAALYRRLGYDVAGEEIAEWDAEDDHGRVYRHRVMCDVMTRSLVDDPRP